MECRRKERGQGESERELGEKTQTDVRGENTKVLSTIRSSRNEKNGDDGRKFSTGS